VGRVVVPVVPVEDPPPHVAALVGRRVQHVVGVLAGLLDVRAEGLDVPLEGADAVCRRRGPGARARGKRG
jgi:hypothetical protein